MADLGKVPSSAELSGPTRVFLCHASTDKEQVRPIYYRLATAGFAPWLDEEDLLPGENWELAIRRAVRAAHFVVVCLSNASTTRAGYVHKEIKEALDVADQQPEGAVFVIPARLEDCEVPGRLRHLHWVDLFNDSGYSRLARVLGRHDPHPRRTDMRSAAIPAATPSQAAESDEDIEPGFHIELDVIDLPGMHAQVYQTLERQGISIRSVEQKGRAD